jgi:hypothetical protein
MTVPGHGERWTDAARGYLGRTMPVVPPIYQCTTFELDDQSYRDIVDLADPWLPGKMSW